MKNARVKTLKEVWGFLLHFKYHPEPFLPGGEHGCARTARLVASKCSPQSRAGVRNEQVKQASRSSFLGLYRDDHAVKKF